MGSGSALLDIIRKVGCISVKAVFISDDCQTCEDEEPVHALDLRIGKAAESITIFDEENVLAESMAGPERTRKKQLSGRFSPFPVHLGRPNHGVNNAGDDESRSRFESRIPVDEEDEDRERWSKEREKEEWIRHLKQIQSVASKETPPNSGPPWSQRTNEVTGSGFLPQPLPDCCTPGFQRPPQTFHPHHEGHSPHPIHPREWPNLNPNPKSDHMSPKPNLPMLDQRRFLNRPGFPPGPAQPPTVNDSDPFQHKFESQSFLPQFPGHDTMRAKNFFQPPHPQQFLMAAAAQQHHQQQQQQQQQQHQYKMNTEQLRRKILSMQNNDSCCKPTNAKGHFPFGEPFFAQTRPPMMVRPPPLLPYENLIKKEPNRSHPDDMRSPSVGWPSRPPGDQITIKEEQKDEEEAREKFNPDKLRSSFLWHVLQRHSAASATPLASHPSIASASASVSTSAAASLSDEPDFTEIDARLKTIEQASGLYNDSSKGPTRRPSHCDESALDQRHSVESRSQFYRPEHIDHHQMLVRMREEGQRKSGVDFGVGDNKKKTLRVSPSPASSICDAVDAASPFSVASPYASSLADPGGNGKRGRPRKHAPKVPLPPIYVFIRNLLYNRYYNPRVVSWVNEAYGIFRINNTNDFARTWGLMKTNRGVKMNYEKLSRAMRYHYGSIKQGRKGHLAMVKEKRLFYRFGELAVNWRPDEVVVKRCDRHDLCKQSLCLWTKE